MKIVWSEPAVADLSALHTYIAKDSVQFANVFISKIISAVDRLAQFPESGRVVPERKVREIREVVYQRYRIIYRMMSDEIVILTVVHGSRDL